MLTDCWGGNYLIVISCVRPRLDRALKEKSTSTGYAVSDGQVWAGMQTGRTLVESDLSLTVVAGTGFEPVTFGL